MGAHTNSEQECERAESGPHPPMQLPPQSSNGMTGGPTPRTPMQLSPQSPNEMTGGTTPRQPFNKGGSRRPYVPLLPKPTEKRKYTALLDQSTHDERMRSIFDAQRLWIRLGEQDPSGPIDPESGFDATEIQFPKYGLEYVKKGLGQTPGKAWAYWRPTLRDHLHF